MKKEVTRTEGEISVGKKEEVTMKSDAEGTKVLSFMQGTIVDVKVKANQEVIKGQTLAILEAMKMENEIVSPVSGVVKKVYIQKQDVVENQEVLMIIE